MEKKHYPCQYPGTCKVTFGRPADLERHYMRVHTDANRKDSFPCDYAKCPRSRSNASFTRKDHYRDHLRDFHKEDIGCAKGQNKGKDRRQWEAKQKRWLEERNISHQHWRCASCLVKNYFYQVGWECSSCGKTCEGERISARWRIVGEKSSLEAGKSEESASTSHQNCNVCKGKSNLSGSWPPTCQASAPHQDFNAYEDFSASQNCNACNGNAWIEDVNRAWVACPMHPYQDFSVFGGTPWIQDTPIGIGDKIIAPHQGLSANPNTHMLPVRQAKWPTKRDRNQGWTSQERSREAAQAAPQAPDTSASFDIHSDGFQEEIELRVDQDREHVKPKYQRPKHDRLYCKQCDSRPEGFRGRHELRRHQDREHSDPTYQKSRHEDEDGLSRHREEIQNPGEEVYQPIQLLQEPESPSLISDLCGKD